MIYNLERYISFDTIRDEFFSLLYFAESTLIRNLTPIIYKTRDILRQVLLLTYAYFSREFTVLGIKQRLGMNFFSLLCFVEPTLIRNFTQIIYKKPRAIHIPTNTLVDVCIFPA